MIQPRRGDRIVVPWSTDQRGSAGLGSNAPFDFAQGGRLSWARFYSARSCFRAAASSAFCSPSIFGYANFKPLSASTIAAATTNRVNHLLSAGTTYQGAFWLAVLW